MAVGEALQGYLSRSGIGPRIAQAQVVIEWPTLVGSQIASVTTPESVSPDTLTGLVRADDPDGIDSIWLSVDSAPPLGADGLLDPTFLATFRAGIRNGHVLGDRVVVQLSGRDLGGYFGVLDTFVVVRGP